MDAEALTVVSRNKTTANSRWARRAVSEGKGRVEKSMSGSLTDFRLTWE
jgi:hypothetical protein